MIVKPGYAKHTITFDSDVQGNAYQAVGSACTLVACMAYASGAAVAVRLYDSRNSEASPERRRVIIGANTGESTPFTPSQPMRFNHGIYVVFEQGGTPFGGEIVLVVNI